MASNSALLPSKLLLLREPRGEAPHRVGRAALLY